MMRKREKKDDEHDGLPEPRTTVAIRRTNTGNRIKTVSIIPIILRSVVTLESLITRRDDLLHSKILLYIRIPPAVKGGVAPRHHPRRAKKRVWTWVAVSNNCSTLSTGRCSRDSVHNQDNKIID